jgi:hypothetical protein
MDRSRKAFLRRKAPGKRARSSSSVEELQSSRLAEKVVDSGVALVGQSLAVGCSFAAAEGLAALFNCEAAMLPSVVIHPLRRCPRNKAVVALVACVSEASFAILLSGLVLVVVSNMSLAV